MANQITRFEGKVAVVTGAAGGLGRAAAVRLAEEGASIVAVDLNRDAIEELAGSLPTRSIAVEGDVAEESTADRYLAAAVEAFGRVDVHHLNAGIFGTFTRLADLSVEEFEKVMRVNVLGQFLGIRAAFRQYRQQRSGGAVSVTASIASLTGSADLFAYHTSKHAVTGLIRSAAVYGGPLGVRVNGVAPGIVPTDLFAAAGNTSGGKNDMEKRGTTSPMRRAGTPEEIAGVVAFLLSEDASYVTGHVLSADGGASISNSARPSGGAGAWDTDAVDRAIYGEDWDR